MFNDIISRPPKMTNEQIVHETNAIMSLASLEDIEFAKSVDYDVQAPLLNVLFTHDILQSKSVMYKCSRYLSKFMREVVSKEKLRWGLERPYVLAERMQIEFKRPYISHSSFDPSYPSGHAAGSRALVYCLLEAYKDEISDEVRIKLFNVSNRIAMSRVQIGVHSLQDIKEGIQLATLTYSKYPLSAI
jgi:hypothetical protein